MKLLIGSLFAVSAALAFAADPPFAEISNLTATAILGWYAWHTATRTIPQLVDDFRTELAAQRKQHQSDREAYFYDSAEERSRRHDDNAALLQAIHDLTVSVSHFNDHHRSAD